MTEFKDTIFILKQSEYFYFLIDDTINQSELDSRATLLELEKNLNIPDNIAVEFWINNELYYPDDNIRLIDLGFNPQINIIEIFKQKITQYNSTEYNCKRGRPLIGIDKIEIKLFQNSKIIYVWEALLENLEKIEYDFSESLYFRENLSDNKFEIEIVEKVRNEILELTEQYLIEIKKKLKKLNN